MKLDKQYEEQVYAGVLGKIIGVYLGRPFEGWTYERIMEELGPINYYVNDKLKQPICVTDDDITGTFTFLRALRDFNYDKNITAKQRNLWPGQSKRFLSASTLQISNNKSMPMPSRCQTNKIPQHQVWVSITKIILILSCEI